MLRGLNQRPQLPFEAQHLFWTFSTFRKQLYCFLSQIWRTFPHCSEGSWVSRIKQYNCYWWWYWLVGFTHSSWQIDEQRDFCHSWARKEFKKKNLEYKVSKNWFGLLCLQAYSFYWCHAWMWHHFLIVGSWKGYYTEKVQDKYWASKSSRGLWFNPKSYMRMWHVAQVLGLDSLWIPFSIPRRPIFHQHLIIY